MLRVKNGNPTYFFISGEATVKGAVSTIRVAFLADVQLRFTLSRVPSSRLQSHIAAHVAALTKPMWIFQRQ